MQHEIRFVATNLRDDHREELKAWVKSLGVDPEDVKNKGLIRMGEQSYELHLSKFVRTANGGILQDWAAGESVTEPLVIDLGTTKCWPTWLETAGQQQLQLHVEQGQGLGVTLQHLLREGRIDLGGAA
jgi:hypothetical protein